MIRSIDMPARKTFKLVLTCVACFLFFPGCQRQDEKYRLTVKDGEVAMIDEHGEERMLMMFNNKRLSMFGFTDKERGFKIVFLLNNDAIESFVIVDEISGYSNTTNFLLYRDTLLDRLGMVGADSVYVEVEEKIFKDGKVEIRTERSE
jgi:hypothetical protein